MSIESNSKYAGTALKFWVWGGLPTPPALRSEKTHVQYTGRGPPGV